jgi:uncharacterized protein (TIGR01777 family)
VNNPRIILAGGSGFLGSSLIPTLIAQSYDVTILTRNPPASAAAHPSGRVRSVHWDANTATPDWTRELNHAHAIVNFVGRSVDCRKTAANKKEILESRTHSVRALAAACAQVSDPPKIWIQTSTAHIYGDTHDEILDESSPLGTGFAPDVGRAWEAELTSALQRLRPREPNPIEVRPVIFRISFVLGRHGGALKTLARLSQCFLGGSTGNGSQYISWIHEQDLNRLILRALADDNMASIYIVTAPNAVTNADFMRHLRRTLHRPWSPPVPAPLVRLGSILLRTDPELALLGRRIVPTRLLSEGFTFQFPTLPEALNDLLQG